MSKIKGVDYNELQALISEKLMDYAKDIENGLDDVCKTTANELKKEINAEGKRAGIGGREYNKSWRYSKDGKKGYIVHSTEYRLTHLLEYGHKVVDRNGTTHGRTRAYTHIATAKDKQFNKLNTRLNNMIKGASR